MTPVAHPIGADAATTIDLPGPPILSVLDRLDRAGGCLPYRAFSKSKRAAISSAIGDGLMELGQDDAGPILSLTDPGAARLSTLESAERHGLCECGCGKATNIAKVTDRSRGRVEGEPLRYVQGHNPTSRNTAHKGSDPGEGTRPRGRL